MMTFGRILCLNLLMWTFLILVVLWCFPSHPAHGRELYPGQYARVEPEIQKWFRSQKSPATGHLCCSEADGNLVEEDIRAGHYWTRGGPFPDWTPVPDEVVIQSGNPNGAPVVWFFWKDGVPAIRCYAPGGGV